MNLAAAARYLAPCSKAWQARTACRSTWRSRAVGGPSAESSAEQRPSCRAAERRDALVSTWLLPTSAAVMPLIMSAFRENSPRSQAAVLSGGAGSALDGAGAGVVAVVGEATATG